jgi:hypothetical protein
MMYQWNRSTGWYDDAGTPTGALNGGGTPTAWEDITSGLEWASANDPSPAGWRVPALDEMRTLLDTAKVSETWTACNGVCGNLFTDKTTGKSLFLPAAGFFDIRNNLSLLCAGSVGGYFSSILDPDLFLSCFLPFGSLCGRAIELGYLNAYLFSVRCVQ